FLLMDLDEKGLQSSAQRLLNRYLELSGDYAALPLLRFYQVYRATVRAKVTAIRLTQEGLEPVVHRQLQEDLINYLELATDYTRTKETGLMITHGLSGSGKSTHTQDCLEALPAIRVRSDIERRRLAGLAPSQSSGSDTGSGIYQAEFSIKTYQRLQELSALIVRAGWVAIVDATFLRRTDRESFRLLADEMNVPFVILVFEVPEKVLRKRVLRRQEQGQDPSEATLEVLEKQLKTLQPLSIEERQFALLVESDHLPIEQIVGRIQGKASPAEA
ncbi:MAG: AAA family ATPase, partial [Sedimenticola sp.]|nr:AAA family ATPase [Sedimenticola sp.]